MSKPNFFSKIGKMVKDISYVGAVEGREALASGLYAASDKIVTLAEKVEPTENQRIKSDSIQKEWEREKENAKINAQVSAA